MLRKLIIFGICAGTSASVPILYQSNTDAVLSFLTSRFSDTPPDTMETAAVEPVAVQPSGRRVNLDRNDLGHFVGSFRFNGRKIEALVDTGATAVAINASTARRIGISVGPIDMTQSVRTANGETRAAIVTIKRLEIGRISLDDVQAVVLDDAALPGTLIGMTFLNRLKKYQVDGAAMVLTQ